MKKWIFPLVLIIVDLIFAILFMTPSIVKVLPQFLLWIRDLTIIVLSGVSKLLRLPTFVDDGQINNVIAIRSAAIPSAINAANKYFLSFP